MKAYFDQPPVVRTVDLEMTEDEARILRAVVGKIRFDAAHEAYRNFHGSKAHPDYTDDQISNAVFSLYTTLDDLFKSQGQ